MKIIKTRLMKFIGKKYLTLYFFVFTTPNAVVTEQDLTHEAIHARQIFEVMALFAIPFMLFNISLGWLILWALSYYVWYGVEWLVHFIRLKDTDLAYRRVSFEREAYINEKHIAYLTGRECFAFFKYIKQK